MNRQQLSKRWSLLLFILGVSLLIRLSFLDYPVRNGEVQRDYLVSRHIFKYHELPLFGPCCLFNGTDRFPLRHNVLYYYLTAFFILIHDSVLFLQLVNIFLQMVTVGLVYLLSKELFGIKTACLATLLFSFSHVILKQSLFFWQPHLMHPFLLLSYLFLACAWRRRRLVFLLLALFSFLFAAAMHTTALGLLPSFILLAFCWLKKEHAHGGIYLFVVGYGIFLCSVLYAPFFINLWINSHIVKELLQSSQNLLVTSFSIWVSHYLQAVQMLIQGFFIFPSSGDSWVTRLLLAVMGVSVCLYPFLQKNRLRKTIWYILILMISQFLVLSAFFQTPIWEYYLTPLFSLTILVFGETIQTVWSTSRMTIVAKLLIIGGLVYVFSLHFYLLMPRPLLYNAHHVDQTTAAIIDQVVILSKDRPDKNLNFFSLEVLGTEVESTSTAQLVFWIPLEQKLNQEFIQVVNRGFDLKYTNSDDYIFVICQSFKWKIDIQKECLVPFFKTHAHYSLQKEVYREEPFSVYLTKNYLNNKKD